MIKNVLTDIGGVGLYGVVSVCLFFTVFVTVLILVLRTKRSHLSHMGALPLEDDQPASKAANATSHE